ncbi:MAG TPA: DUF2855 family protein [Solirubrobacteraceae bacterium]|nr:DUF2855 family protein [Solirubrobacteraceae bacterium]
MPELQVRRNDLASCQLVAGESRSEEPAEGEAQLRIERFALTSNNVTYATRGDELGYWRLFPAPEGWGRIPAWGYARVVASRSTAVAEGARLFGIVPMAGYVTVCPQAHRIGFVDAAPHRSELAPVYNRYMPVDEAADDAALVMRPLFGTSLVLDLVLAEAAFNGARTVVLTSASSKTGYGVAHLLRDRDVETIGLTSADRRTWVQGLDLYDEVLTYDDVADLGAPDGAVLVDFAGDSAVVRRVHEKLGNVLRRSIRVGFTHWAAVSDEAPLPGPIPEFFFAPTEMARRGRELTERYLAAWPQFAPVVQRTMRIERVTDGDVLIRAYRELLAGRVDPAVGHVVSL